MHIHSSDAVILRHLDYGEADRIVTFLTAEHGVMKGFARGARKSRRRFGPALESFASVRLHWSAPRSGAMVSLREAELLDLRTALRADLGTLALAGYGCELLEALLGEGDGHAEAFALLRAFLDRLGAAGAEADARLLFELRLLSLAGYIPHLLHCSECGMVSQEETVGFDPARGGALCAVCAPTPDLRVDRLTLGTLARSLRTPIELFEGFRFGDRTRTQAGALLSAALRRHLHRPLRSIAFLEEVLGHGASRPR